MFKTDKIDLTLDGIDVGNTGVMVLHNGRIRGGDAFFDYLGSYTSANGNWKGELINHEHTPSQGERPVFGGYEVGIGFPAPAPKTARSVKRLRWPANAAFASAPS